MSYSFNNPCWNCQKHQKHQNIDGVENPCKDEETIRNAINDIHQRTFEQGHKGSGEVLLMCSKMLPINK
jgi:hypothetical protein